MASAAFSVKIAYPSDQAWKSASDAVKAEYRGWWRDLVGKAKDKELAKGKDRHGANLVAIAKSTRDNRRSAMGPADPDAPPLTPAYGLSRTRSLFRGRIKGDTVQCFWGSHEGEHWGKILAYHRRGAGNLPVRDVIGLSKASEAWVKRTALRYWAARGAGLVAREKAKVWRKIAPGKVVTPLRPEVAARVEEAAKMGTFTGFRKLGPR